MSFKMTLQSNHGIDTSIEIDEEAHDDLNCKS